MKPLPFLFAIVLFCLHVNGQSRTSQKIKSGEFALPGEDYGLGLTLPPIIFNDDPVIPVVNSFDDDMSVELFPDSTGLLKLSCSNYFTVFFHGRLNSAEVLKKANFTIIVSVPHEPDQNIRITYTDNGTNTFRGSFKMKYAFYFENVKGRGLVKRYFRKTYSVTAAISGGYIPHTSINTFIHDPNPDNNQDISKFLSPLPPVCPDRVHTE